MSAFSSSWNLVTQREGSTWMWPFDSTEKKWAINGTDKQTSEMLVPCTDVKGTKLNIDELTPRVDYSTARV